MKRALAVAVAGAVVAGMTGCGGEWAVNRCLYPYATLGPVLSGGAPCS